MAEMSWSNLKTEGNGELTQTLKLQQGQNQMRLVSLPYECHVHWEDTVEGAHKRVVCSGTGCPICNAGHTPQKRFQVLVIDRVDGKVKVLEGGNAIFNQIKSFAMDEDYGDPRDYDIKITKAGAGRDTRYTVMPSPKKSKITAAEEELVANTKTLAELNKVKTLDELLEMDLEVLQSLKKVNDDDGWGDDDNMSSNDDDDDWGDL